MRWIVIRDKGLAVSVECPKCHNRFTIVKRKDWKCCPICGTKMSGYTDRKTEPQKKCHRDEEYACHL